MATGYLEKACAKLGVRTRIKAVAVAVRNGFIDPKTTEPLRSRPALETKGGGSGTSVQKPEVSAVIAADATRPLAQDQRLSVPEPAEVILSAAEPIVDSTHEAEPQLSPDLAHQALD